VPQDLLSIHAAHAPDKPALVEDGRGRALRSWSFVELDRWSNRLARVLIELGVEPLGKVVTCGHNSASLMAAAHGIRRAGAVNVPLNYRLTADEAAYVVDNSDATVLYVDAEELPLVDAIRQRVPQVREILVFDGDGALEARVEAQPASAPERDVAPGVGASMIYTSGTTGRPKGALRTKVDPALTAGLVARIGYQPDDIYLTTGPLYHSGPLGFAVIAHALGNTVVIQRRFDAEDWLRLVDAHRVSTTFSAPAPIRMICELAPEIKARYDRSSMRRMIANAAPWSQTLKRRYLADFPADSLWEVYGSTEMGVDTVLAPADQLRKPGSCGLPAPGIEIKLFDDDGVEVTEPGAAGELYVRSASMFDTYYKADDKYEADRRGDFHTVGDIAYRDDEGYLYIADRKKDMIISGGMNVYPAEVEAVLEQHPAILEAAVFAIPSEEWGETVHASVVLRPGAELGAEEVTAFSRQHLAGYKIPRSVSFHDELPRTGSGKVLKRELRAPWWAGHDPSAG